MIQLILRVHDCTVSIRLTCFSTIVIYDTDVDSAVESHSFNDAVATDTSKAGLLQTRSVDLRRKIH